MAKFKKGDRVKVIKDSLFWDKDTVLTVDEESHMPFCKNDTGKRDPIAEEDLELLTPQYTPITPKVGEKYRVLKRSQDANDNINLYTGQIIEVTHLKGQSATGDCYIIERGGRNYIRENFFTTEYLELVSEPAQNITAGINVETVTGQSITTTGYPSGFYIDGGGGVLKNGKIVAFAGFAGEVEEEPINQSIIKKTMNLIKKALLSKDDKNLIKAGYMDDNMNLTGRGREALEFITFTENKAKLVEMAEAQIAEDKEDKE